MKQTFHPAWLRHARHPNSLNQLGHLCSEKLALEYYPSTFLSVLTQFRRSDRQNRFFSDWRKLPTGNVTTSAFPRHVAKNRKMKSPWLMSVRSLRLGAHKGHKRTWETPHGLKIRRCMRKRSPFPPGIDAFPRRCPKKHEEKPLDRR